MIHWRSIAGRLNKSLVIVVHCRAACAQGGWPRAISGVFTPRANCVRGCSWVSRVYTLWMMSVGVDWTVYIRERTNCLWVSGVYTSKTKCLWVLQVSTPLRVNCLRACWVSHPEDELSPWGLGDYTLSAYCLSACRGSLLDPSGLIDTFLTLGSSGRQSVRIVIINILLTYECI